VAKNPAKTAFNPLFVHGNSGVGKTHLCHAIGAKVQELYPDKKVLYLSAHLFKVQFTDARRFNTINDFINFYQGIDVFDNRRHSRTFGTGKKRKIRSFIFSTIYIRTINNW